MLKFKPLLFQRQKWAFRLLQTSSVFCPSSVVAQVLVQVSCCFRAPLPVAVILSSFLNTLTTCIISYSVIMFIFYYDVLCLKLFGVKEDFKKQKQNKDSHDWKRKMCILCFQDIQSRWLNENTNVLPITSG